MPRTTKEPKKTETKYVSVNSHVRKQQYTLNSKKEFMAKHSLTPETYYFQLAEMMNKYPVDYLIEELGWYHLDRQRNKLYARQY